MAGGQGPRDRAWAWRLRRGRGLIWRRCCRSPHLQCHPLAALETAITIEDMNLPGFRLHPLAAAERGRWSIWVNGNWRITFAFQGGNVDMFDEEDNH